MVPWRSAWATDGRALRWVCAPWQAPWGAHPVSILVPCHRIVGARGALGGYAGGVERKVALLAHEGKWGDGCGVANNDWFFGGPPQ